MYREARLPSRLSQAARSFISIALVKVGGCAATPVPVQEALWLCSALSCFNVQSCPAGFCGPEHALVAV
jgi:hypothetical protein